MEALLKASGPEAVENVLSIREEAINNAEIDPLNFGFALEGWKYADEMLEHHDTLMIFGGNRCLAGEQEIYDPVQQKSLRVDEIEGDFHVWALNDEGRKVITEAQKPFQKPSLDLHEIETSSGQRLRVSNTHLSKSFGEYRPIGDLTFFDVHDCLYEVSDLPLSDGCHLLSTLDIYPSTSLEDVQRLMQTAQDSRWNYSAYLRLDDGQLRHVLDSVLYDSPCLDDVQEYISYVFEQKGGNEYKSQCIRLYLQFDLPSIRDAQHQNVGQCAGRLCHASDKLYRQALQSREDREFFEAHRQSIVEFSHRLQSSFLSGTQGSRFYCISALGGNRLYYNTVVKSDFLRNDTVWDFTVPEHHNYFIGDTVHHNSSKTEYGARSVVKAAIENPKSIIVCFAQDADASIRTQQAAVYRYLPPEFKQKTKGVLEYLNYTVKNGFTGQSFILPNGSQVLFHTYSQFIANRSKFEGLELGSKNPTWHNVALWPDEYLEDGDLIRTMRFRLATRNGKMLLTFTPIDGYTPFVAEFLKGVETLNTRKAPLLDDEEVPVTQYSEEKDAGIVYFHSEFNPFGGYDRIAKELRHSTLDEIRTRAYGIPVKSMTSLFPMFSQSVHVLKHEDFPDISDKQKFTCYQVVDPAGARNYTSLWAGVTGSGSDSRIYIRREWPDRKTYGAWAEFGDPNWKFGPASKKLGYNVEGYCKLFKEIEEDLCISVFERIGDSRFFANENADNTDLFTLFSEHDFHFVPSSGIKEEQGLAVLDNWFYYNPNVAIDEANSPRVFIHEDCGNLIFALINYGALGKKDEALKDFPDCARYLGTANGGEGPEHYADGKLGVLVKSGGY